MIICLLIRCFLWYFIAQESANLSSNLSQSSYTLIAHICTTALFHYTAQSCGLLVLLMFYFCASLIESRFS